MDTKRVAALCFPQRPYPRTIMYSHGRVFVSMEQFNDALAQHHARWDLIPLPPHAELGISLRLMRQLEHWPAFSEGFVERRANAYARAIKPYEPPPAPKLDIYEQIGWLAEQIHLATNDSDVRVWADDILSLLPRGSDAASNK